MQDINQVLLNPIRSRILQFVATHETATAGEIASLMTDVPRTTLYRHLKILTENNVITVVAENRVRGSVERTYALNLKALSDLNTTENALQNAFGFLMKIYGDFAEYFSDSNATPGIDKIFLSNAGLMLSDEEFDEFLSQLSEMLKKHVNNAPDGKRKQRSISFISSPSNEERKGKK
jgi:DNA-binding transcriptional ArsR family regulator